MCVVEISILFGLVCVHLCTNQGVRPLPKFAVTGHLKPTEKPEVISMERDVQWLPGVTCVYINYSGK